MIKRVILFLILFLMGSQILYGGELKPAPAKSVQWLVASVGNTAYKQGDYAVAIEQYEEVLNNGFENGALYFNLGNSYYRKGELGKAILNYERARKFLPRDSDLNFNYHYALSQVKNGREKTSLNFLERFLEGLGRFYSTDEMATILTILFILLGLGYLFSLYLKWTVRIRRLTLILLGTLFVVYGVGMVYKIKGEKHAAIILKESPVKFEPREEATTYFELAEGEKIKIVKEEELWVKVKRGDGKLGWTKKESLEKI